MDIGTDKVTGMLRKAPFWEAHSFQKTGKKRYGEELDFMIIKF